MILPPLPPPHHPIEYILLLINLVQLIFRFANFSHNAVDVFMFQLGCLRGGCISHRNHVPLTNRVRGQKHTLLLHSVQAGYRYGDGRQARQPHGAHKGARRVQGPLRRNQICNTAATIADIASTLNVLTSLMLTVCFSY